MFESQLRWALSTNQVCWIRFASGGLSILGNVKPMATIQNIFLKVWLRFLSLGKPFPPPSETLNCGSVDTTASVCACVEACTCKSEPIHLSVGPNRQNYIGVFSGLAFISDCCRESDHHLFHGFNLQENVFNRRIK